MVFVEKLFYMNESFFAFWGYLVVFLAIFLESFPFLGAFVPGGLVALLACGFLARLGYFALWKVVVVGILASSSVDIFGYFFGKSRAKGFLHRKSRIFLVKHSTIDKVTRAVRGHTVKSLIFGKINPITRSIAPFIFGNERVGFFRFLISSIIGSTIWVTCFMFLGYILGSSYTVIVKAEQYILWVGVVLLGLFYFFWVGNLFKEYFFNKVNGNNKQK